VGVSVWQIDIPEINRAAVEIRAHSWIRCKKMLRIELTQIDKRFNRLYRKNPTLVIINKNMSRPRDNN